jgi:hypothetical protein
VALLALRFFVAYERAPDPPPPPIPLPSASCNSPSETRALLLANGDEGIRPGARIVPAQDGTGRDVILLYADGSHVRIKHREFVARSEAAVKECLAGLESVSITP